MKHTFTRKSGNRKTGPIPVTSTESKSCPPSCGMFDDCYAKFHHIKGHWDRLDNGTASNLCSTAELATHIRALPEGQLWRHNEKGDLPGRGGRINGAELSQIVKANTGRRGFTYTHKPLTPANVAKLRTANESGFTVNASADDLTQADRAMDLGLPTVVVLPLDSGNCKTPKGRSVVVCPAIVAADVTCKTCSLCQVADRKSIVGFPAHGAAKVRVTKRLHILTETLAKRTAQQGD